MTPHRSSIYYAARGFLIPALLYGDTPDSKVHGTIKSRVERASECGLGTEDNQEDTQ